MSLGGRARHAASRCRPRAALLVTAGVAAGLVAASHAAAPPAGGPVALVVCAPGYPGSTAEAQPAMDALAAAAAVASGWKPGELTAIYFETERAGVDRLAGGEVTLALVPLPFWLQHRAAFKLAPRLQAIREGGDAAEPWSLVAAAGAVAGAASLTGFELLSPAAYAPRFVRGPVLGSWGTLPPNVTITFSSSVLSGLRRAAAGDKVVVLVDRAQVAALATLPFAAKLEVVARSTPLPVSVLCTVGGRQPSARLASLLHALPSLGDSPAGREALAGVRLARFAPADLAALARAEEAFEQVKE